MTTGLRPTAARVALLQAVADGEVYQVKQRARDLRPWLGLVR
jgi:hypothetical protein